MTQDIAHHISFNRRQIVSGLAGVALDRHHAATGVRGRHSRRTQHPPLSWSTCRTASSPGGSLAVKDGDQIIPIINKLAAGFQNVVSRRTGTRRGMCRSPPAIPARSHSMSWKLPYGDQVLWPDHCVQGTDGAELSKRP